SAFVERKGTEIFRFDSPGVFLRGRLIEIDVTDISGKATTRYAVHDEDDDRLWSFLGTIDLNSKIRRSDIGKVIEIRFEGTTDSQPGKTPVKRFWVGVKG